MININKTYNFNNSTNFLITKTAQVLVDDIPHAATIAETPNTLNVISSISSANKDIVIKIFVTVDGHECTKEFIDPLDELIKPQLISLHFRGEYKTHVIESNFKFQNLLIENIFNSCSGVSYKYAPQHNVTNWSSFPILSFAQLFNTIESSTSPFSIRIEISDYNNNAQDCGLCLSYTTKVPITSTQYSFSGISQDVIVWLNKKINLSSVTTSSNLSVSYSILDSNFPNNLIGENILNLNQLNAAISSLAPNSQYAFQIWASYNSSVSNGTVTLNSISI